MTTLIPSPMTTNQSDIHGTLDKLDGGRQRTLLLCLVFVVCICIASLPAKAQNPASNQATLNFVGADIESVVRAIGHYTGNTFIIDPRVKGTINLVSEKPVTKTQAFEMLTSVLRLQGYAVVRTPDYVKVLPEADAKLQAGPVQTGKLRGDQITTQIFRLNHESANGLVTVLRPPYLGEQHHQRRPDQQYADHYRLCR